MLQKFSIPLMFIVFAVGIWTGFGQTRPPAPPGGSGADYPAYERMLANLKAMTVAPHPVESAQLEAVRTYLLAQIRGMGLEASVDPAVFTPVDPEGEHHADGAAPAKDREAPEKSNPVPQRKPPEGAVAVDESDGLSLKNIWVKLDAPGTDRGVLMLAHYDSKSRAPGAADDMVSVCALLEAMRKQAGNAGLKEDLYFLFTDGEEEGALGSDAFIHTHPELRGKIDLAINFDARGDRGGLLMFETSSSNEELLRHFQSASSRPLAFSFTTGLYRRMPNGTDLTGFLDAGYPGLNFAVAEGVEHYHQPTDSFDNLDRGTAYNFLQTALEMADYAGEAHFQDIRSSRNSVFFTFLSGHLVVMSDLAAYGLSGFALLASLGWMLAQLRPGKIKLRQIAAGTAWLLGTMAAAGLLSWGVVAVLTRLLGLGETTNNDAAFICVALAAGFGVLAATSLRMRKQSLAGALAGLLPVQWLLLAGTTVFFYEVSYLFALSTLGMLIVAVLDRYPAVRMAASALLGAGILLLYVPLCWLVYVLFMLPAAPVAVALGVLPTATLAMFFAARCEPSPLPVSARDNASPIDA